MPDPKRRDIEHHFLWVAAADMPAGLPLGANARIPNINRGIYEEVQESLADDSEDGGFFHLKNLGIIVVADSVRKIADGVFDVVIDPARGGILNGGHTNQLLVDSQEKEPIPDNYVLVAIRTGVPQKWVPEMSGGLNTTVQVQPKSLDNLAGYFKWIKEELGNEPYFKEIVFREGDDGSIDIRDIIAMMTCMNVARFPNSSDESPIAAYEKKSQCLDWFESDEGSYRKLRPILKDILRLYDIIRAEARDLYNADKSDGQGRKGGALSFVDQRKRGVFKFVFISEEKSYALNPAAAYPILAAFRWMVEEAADGTFRWKGRFDDVVRLWRESAGELMRLTKQTSDEVGRRPNALGKSRPHWSNLHARVANRQMKTELDRQLV
jgi:hypothetical protein